MVTPSAFAVLRLMTSSNLVGCSTGKSPGLAPLQNSIDVACGAAEYITVTWSITDQAAFLGKSTIWIHRRQAFLCGKSQDLVSLAIEDWIGNNDEGLYGLFLHRFERSLNREVSAEIGSDWSRRFNLAAA